MVPLGSNQLQAFRPEDRTRYMFSGINPYAPEEDPEITQEKLFYRDALEQLTQAPVDVNQYSLDQLRDISNRLIGNRPEQVQVMKEQQGEYEGAPEILTRRDTMTLEELNANLPTSTEIPEPPADLFEKYGQDLAGFKTSVARQIQKQNTQQLMQDLGQEYKGEELNAYLQQLDEDFNSRNLNRQAGESTTPAEPWEVVYQDYLNRQSLMEKELLTDIDAAAKAGTLIKGSVLSNVLGDKLLRQSEELAGKDTKFKGEGMAEGIYDSIAGMISDLMNFGKEAGPGLAKLANKAVILNPAGMAPMLNSLAQASIFGSGDPAMDAEASKLLEAGPVPVIKDLQAREGIIPGEVEEPVPPIQLENPGMFAEFVDGLNFLDEDERKAVKLTGYGFAGATSEITNILGNAFMGLASLKESKLGLVLPGPSSPGVTKSARTAGEFLKGQAAESKELMESSAAAQGLLSAARGATMVGTEVLLAPAYATGTRGTLAAGQAATKAGLQGLSGVARGAEKALPYVPKAVAGTARVGSMSASIGAGTIVGGISGGPLGAAFGAVAAVAGTILRRTALKDFGGVAKLAERLGGKKVYDAIQGSISNIFEKAGPKAAAELAAKFAKMAEKVGDAKLAGYWWDVAGTTTNIGLVNGVVSGLQEGSIEAGFNGFVLGVVLGGAPSALFRAVLPNNLKYARNVFTPDELKNVTIAKEREMVALAQSNFGDEVKLEFATDRRDATNRARSYTDTPDTSTARSRRRERRKAPETEKEAKALAKGEVAPGSLMVQDKSGKLKLILYPDAKGSYTNSLMDALPDTIMRGTSNPAARARLNMAVYQGIPASQLDAFAKAKGLSDYRINVQSSQKLVSEVIKEQIKMLGADAFQPRGKLLDARALFRGVKGDKNSYMLEPSREVQKAVQDILQTTPDAEMIIKKSNNVWKVYSKEELGKGGKGPEGGATPPKGKGGGGPNDGGGSPGTRPEGSTPAQVTQAVTPEAPVQAAIPEAPAQPQVPQTPTQVSTKAVISKAELDADAKKLGANDAKQFNSKYASRQDHTPEQRALLERISERNNQIRQLNWEDASKLDADDFATWENSRLNNYIKTDNDLIETGKLQLAHKARGNTEAAEKVRNTIANSKRPANETVESWNKSTGEKLSQKEIEAQNKANAEWNDSVDNMMEVIDGIEVRPTPIQGAVAKSTAAVTPTQAVSEATVTARPEASVKATERIQARKRASEMNKTEKKKALREIGLTPKYQKQLTPEQQDRAINMGPNFAGLNPSIVVQMVKKKVPGEVTPTVVPKKKATTKAEAVAPKATAEVVPAPKAMAEAPAPAKATAALPEQAKSPSWEDIPNWRQKGGTINYPVRARMVDGKPEVLIRFANGDNLSLVLDNPSILPELTGEWADITVPFKIERTGKASVVGQNNLWTMAEKLLGPEMADIPVQLRATARKEARQAAKEIEPPQEVYDAMLDWDSLKDDAIGTYSKKPNKKDWDAEMAKKINKKRKKGGFLDTEVITRVLNSVWNSLKGVFDNIVERYQSSRFSSTRGAVGDLAGKGGMGKKLTPEEILKKSVNPAENLAMKASRKPTTGIAKNPLTKFEVDVDGQMKPIYVGGDTATGRKTFDAWIEEVDKWMSPEEITSARVWYNELKGKFGELGYDEDVVMGWLASQQNASPIAGLQNLFRVQDRLAGLTHGKKGGLADNKIEAILKGEAPDGGYGPKLTDFADAGMGRTSRTYMGGKPEGGKPFVADVHTGRDSGHVDQQTLTRLMDLAGSGKLSINGQKVTVNKQAVKTKTIEVKGKSREVPEEVTFNYGNQSVTIKRDMTGSPSGKNYEAISEWGNDLSDYMNSMNYGGGNWTPAEAQAVGWMRILKQYGLPASTVEDALRSNTFKVFAEVNYSSGNVLPKIYPGFSSLPVEIQRTITSDVLTKTAQEVSEIVGGSIKVRSITAADGLYGGEISPSVGIQVMGSPEAASIFQDALAFVGEQRGTLGTKFGTGGKDSQAIIFRKSDGTALKESEFASLIESAKIGGATVERTPSGNGYLILDATPDYTPKAFNAKNANMKSQSILDWAKNNGMELEVEAVPIKVKATGNDWKASPDGKAYLDNIKDLGGASRIKQLKEFREQRYKDLLEESISKYAPNELPNFQKWRTKLKPPKK